MESVLREINRSESVWRTRSLRLPRKFLWAAQIAVLALISVLPFICIQADPPYNVNHTVYTDEGIHLYAARNKALFGTWALPEEKLNPYHVHWELSSLGLFFLLPHTLLNCLVFRLFGTGLLQARVLCALEGVLALWLLYLIIKRLKGRQQAFATAALWGSSFLYLIFIRTGQTYALLYLMAVVTTGCMTAASRSARYAAVAGLMCFLMVVTHLISSYLFAVFLVAYVFWAPGVSHQSVLHKWLRIPLAFLLPFLLLLGVWWVFYLSPHRELLIPHFQLYFPPVMNLPAKEALEKISEVITERNCMLAFEKMPLVAYLGFLGAAVRIGVGNCRQHWSFVEVLCAIWLFVGTVFGSIFVTQQIRYFSLLALPASILAGWLLMNAQDVRNGWPILSRFRKALTFMLMALVQGLWLSYYLRRFGWFNSHIGSTVLERGIIVVVLSGLTAVGLLLVLLRMRRYEGTVKWSLLIAAVIVGFASYTKYLFSARSFTWTHSRYFKQILKPGDRVDGMLAPTLVVDSKAKGLYVLDVRYPGLVLSQKTIRNLGITHLVLAENQMDEYKRAMPELMAQSKLLHTMFFVSPTPEIPEEKILLFAVGREAG